MDKQQLMDYFTVIDETCDISAEDWERISATFKREQLRVDWKEEVRERSAEEDRCVAAWRRRAADAGRG